MLVKACLNGNRSPDEHPAIPCTPEELASEAASAVAQGAAAVHVHPRRPDSRETLDPDRCAEVVAAFRAACPGIPIGLTTGAWIEPDLTRRLTAIAAWEVLPDFCSVNFSERGHLEVCELLLRKRVGVEAGLLDVSDARSFIESPVVNRCLRVLIEIDETEDEERAVLEASRIDEALEIAGITSSRLDHGTGLSTWAVIEAGIRKGHDIRIGLEDTLQLPDGRTASGNGELVAAAIAMAHGHGR
jgi:uncharacterized protein (DUF849 family)